MDSDIQFQRSAFLVVSEGCETSRERAAEEVAIRRALVSKQAGSAGHRADVDQENGTDVRRSSHGCVDAARAAQEEKNQLE